MNKQDESLTYKKRPRVHANRRIDTPEEFDAMVDAYVAEQEEEHRAITITGLTLALGFASRQSFYDYGEVPGFEASVARARLIVGDWYEQRLNGAAPTGAIFALKNMGWSDKQQLDLGNAEDKPFEVTDTSRAARLKGLVALAKGRRGEGEDDGEDLC